MNYNFIFENLNNNKSVFQKLLFHTSEAEYLWKSSPDKWCLLEIVCHLYDEEREDFRTRVKFTLETPEQASPPIDPVGWVTSREYIKQDYLSMLNKFLEERDDSIRWLHSLKSPEWGNAYQHPKYGPMSAKMFVTNWLAHDYLHIRQIIKLKLDYLKKLSGESLVYAGEW